MLRCVYECCFGARGRVRGCGGRRYGVGHPAGSLVWTNSQTFRSPFSPWSPESVDNVDEQNFNAQDWQGGRVPSLLSQTTCCATTAVAAAAIDGYDNGSFGWCFGCWCFDRGWCAIASCCKQWSSRCRDWWSAHSLGKPFVNYWQEHQQPCFRFSSRRE